MIDISSPYDALYRGYTLNPQGVAAQDSSQTVTYSELLSRVQALALGLRENAPDNRRVGLCAKNHVDHLVAYLAIFAAGLIWVPMNPKNGQILNQKLLEKAQVSKLIADKNSLAGMPEGSYEVLTLDSEDLFGCAALIERHRNQPFTPSVVHSEDILAIKFTGGSTGEPKGVMQSWRNMRAVMQSLISVFRFNSDDCNLAVAPLTHGASHYVLPVLATGGRHLLLETPDIGSIQKAFIEQGASISFMPPTLIYKLLDAPGTTPQTFASLRHLTYSAAPMPRQRVQQALQVLGQKLSTVYGQTEAPMVITALLPSELAQPQYHESVGKAGPYCEVAVLDSHYKPVPSGQIGEIAVKGDIVMAGYLDQPEKTEKVLTGGNNPWLLTGDLGCVDDDGYVFIKGRSSEVIISGGFNIYPAEVENALMAIDDVRECAVFSVEDEYWGEKLEAAVCLNETVAFDSDALIKQLKGKLGPVKTPKKIHHLELLPRNPVGKIVRQDIRQLVYSSNRTVGASRYE